MEKVDKTFHENRTFYINSAKNMLNLLFCLFKRLEANLGQFEINNLKDKFGNSTMSSSSKITNFSKKSKNLKNINFQLKYSNMFH